MIFFSPHKYLFFLLLLYSCTTYAQSPWGWADSIKKTLPNRQADTSKVMALVDLSNSYQLYNPDSGLFYGQQALTLSEKLNYEVGVFWSVAAINASLIFTGNYPMELDNAFRALAISKKLDQPRSTGYANGMLSDYYYNLGEYSTSLSYWREVVKIAEKWFPDELVGIWANLSRIFNALSEPDSAMYYARKSYAQSELNLNFDKENSQSQAMVSLLSTLMGNAFAGKAGYDSALYYFHKAIPVSTNFSLETNVIDAYNGIADVYNAKNNSDSVIWYAGKVLNSRIAKSYPVSLLKATNLLSLIYEERNNTDSTLKYLRMATALKDSLFAREKMITIKNLTYKEQEKQQEIEASRINLQNRYKFYFLLLGFVVMVAIGAIVIRNKRQKQLQNMRNSIADDLHDDIGSGLSSIGIMNELARAKSPEALSLLTSIGETTIAIQENMSDIVWAIKSDNDRFENVLQRMNNFASEILEAKNIALDFNSDASLSASRLTMEQRKNFYLFFKEAINNAAKYADAKKMTVAITQKVHYVEMIITDNGKGFDTNQAFSGNGMSSLKKRAAELNGDFRINSTINEGTVVQLKFKIT